MNKEALFNQLRQSLPWKGEDYQAVIACSLNLRRNLEAYSFPQKLSQQDKKQLFSLIKDTLQVLFPQKELASCSLKTLSPEEREFIYEYFFCHNAFEYSSESTEALIFVSPFLCILNLNDHLQIQVVDTQNDLEGCWNQLSSFEHALSEKLSFAHHKHFGYLTYDIHQSGTAFTPHLLLQLPALAYSGNLPDFLKQQLGSEFSYHFLQEKSSEVSADVLFVKPRYVSGVSEDHLLAALRRFINQVQSAERSVLKPLKDNPPFHLKDQLSRAYGLLLSACQLNVFEALSCLGKMRLALQLGWLQGISDAQLLHWNQKIKKGHLILAHPTSTQEVDVLRASELKQCFQGLSFKLP